MAFGFGGSSSSTRSESQSSSQDFGMDYGYTYLDPRQAQMQQNFGNQYQGTINQWQNMRPDYQVGVNQAINNAYNFGSNAVPVMAPGQFGGIGGGTVGAGSNRYLNQLGEFADEGSPFLGEQIDQFGEDLDRQFGRLQQRLGGTAASANQRGSSRQGIAESLALGENLAQYRRGVTGLRTADLARRQQAAQAAAGIEGQRYAAATSAAAQRAAAAQAARASMYGSYLDANTAFNQQNLAATELGLRGTELTMDMLFNPFQIGTGYIGGPNTLSENFGFDWGESQSTSSSRGDSSSARFGFGPG